MSKIDNTTRTTDVLASIEHYAKAMGIGVDKVDFNIKTYKTIASLKQGTLIYQTNGAFKTQVFDSSVKLPLDIWLNPDLDIIQEYEIEFIPHVFDKKFAIELSIGANKTLTNAVAIIKKESRIAKASNIDTLLINELNKRKLKSKMMIGLFDAIMIEDIERLSAKIMNEGALTHDFRVTLCHCPDYEPQINDKLRFIFLEKIAQDDSPLHKSLIAPINAGDELIEYTKAQDGKSARGINGVFHLVPEPTKSNLPFFEISEAIRIDENTQKTIFTAMNSGFVIYDGKSLDIQKELNIDRIDAKTGSIDLGMGMDAKIEITQTKPNEDSIVGGMSARAYSIKLNGGVGDGAKIYANSCVIDGQIHSNAYIEAVNATLRKLKGKLIAKEATIHMLENGYASADILHIDSMFGGIAKADIAKVGIAGPNCEFFIKESLHIESPNGDGIKIYISPAATTMAQAKHNEIKAEFDLSQKESAAKLEKLKYDMQILENNKDTILKLRAKYTPSSPHAAVIAEQIKRFGLLAKEAKNLEAEIAALKLTIEKNRVILLREENAILNTSITATNKWRHGASFKLNIKGMKKECILELPENSDVKRIWIIKDEDTDEYIFKTSRG